MCALIFYALRFVISCFHALILEPPMYCIPRERRMYTLLWSWQNIEAVCSMQLLCRTGQTRGNRMVGEWSDKAVGHLGGVWGP